MQMYDYLRDSSWRRVLTMANLGVIAMAILLSSCGRKEKGSDSGSDSPAENTPPTDGTQIPDRVEGSGEASKTKIQLSDEAIGVKTGAQIIAHFSLVTGIQQTDFNENEQRTLDGLKKALPEKNSLETFSAAHPPAAVKVATYYCLKLINREHAIQNGKGDGKAALLPSVDYDSQKPLSTQVARVFYEPLLKMFAGEDTATLPDKALVEKTLDEFIERLKAVPPEQNRGAIGAKRMVIGMCTTVATSFASLWI